MSERTKIGSRDTADSMHTAGVVAAVKPERSSTLLRMGHKLPDGQALQKATEVEIEVRGGKRVVVGPEGLRPAILLGTEV